MEKSMLRCVADTIIAEETQEEPNECNSQGKKESVSDN